MNKRYLWNKWADELRSIAHSGISHSQNPYDTEKYKAIQTIAIEIFSNFSNLSHQELLEICSKDFGYITPKVAVRAGLFNENNQILLAKEKENGKWVLPGGWADLNETPSQAIIREIREETGYNVRVIKLAAVYDNRKRAPASLHVYGLFFVCEIIEGNFSPNVEISEVGFFEKSNIPVLSEGKTNKQLIELLFNHYNNIDLMTEFD